MATTSSDPYRYFTQGEIKALFQLGDTEQSETFLQLEQAHGEQVADDELTRHVASLHGKHFYAASNHALLFSRANKEEHLDAQEKQAARETAADKGERLRRECLDSARPHHRHRSRTTDGGGQGSRAGGKGTQPDADWRRRLSFNGNEDEASDHNSGFDEDFVRGSEDDDSDADHDNSTGENEWGHEDGAGYESELCGAFPATDEAEADDEAEAEADDEADDDDDDDDDDMRVGRDDDGQWMEGGDELDASRSSYRSAVAVHSGESADEGSRVYTASPSPAVVRTRGRHNRFILSDDDDDDDGGDADADDETKECAKGKLHLEEPEFDSMAADGSSDEEKDELAAKDWEQREGVEAEWEEEEEEDEDWRRQQGDVAKSVVESEPRRAATGLEEGCVEEQKVPDDGGFDADDEEVSDDEEVEFHDCTNITDASHEEDLGHVDQDMVSEEHENSQVEAPTIEIEQDDNSHRNKGQHQGQWMGQREGSGMPLGKHSSFLDKYQGASMIVANTEGGEFDSGEVGATDCSLSLSEEESDLGDHLSDESDEFVSANDESFHTADEDMEAEMEGDGGVEIKKENQERQMQNDCDDGITSTAASLQPSSPLPSSAQRRFEIGGSVYDSPVAFVLSPQPKVAASRVCDQHRSKHVCVSTRCLLAVTYKHLIAFMRVDLLLI